MNAFDLNRKEYIRVDNNGGDPLTDFKKVTFLTSFVITADTNKFLPATFSSNQVTDSNGNLLNNINSYCFDNYDDATGYACYISEMSINITGEGKLIPTAKVNVYAMDGRDITA